MRKSEGDCGDDIESTYKMMLAKDLRAGNESLGF